MSTSKNTACSIYQERSLCSRFWGRLSIRQKGLSISLLAMALSLLIAGAGVWGVVSLNRSMDESAVSAHAIRNHMQADMLHDALRADVYRGVMAAQRDDAVELERTRRDVAEHVEGFHAAIAKNQGLPHAQEVKAALDGLVSPLQGYARAAAETIDTAQNRPDRIEASLPAFQASFEALAQSMEKVSEHIEARVDESDRAGDAAGDQAKMLTVVAIVVALALSVGIYFVISCAVVKPMTEMTSVMRTLANGDATVAIPARDREDEIGQMAQAVEVFKENAIAKQRLEAEQAEMKQRAEAERKRAMAAMADAFDAEVRGLVTALSESATEMQSTSQSMSATAEETNRQAAAVAAASNQASANVQTVAAAAEELASSIGEIGRQMSASHAITKGAAEQAERSQATVRGLAQAAEKIGAIVGMINSIASQTNLLALNATIEAARAGEAGRGFAVVANEVKTLSNQTAKATDEIASQIHSLRGEIAGTVGAIEGITGTIGKINEIAANIAAAVEEQNAATSEIARNVEQAAVGTQEVTSNIAGVTEAAGDTGAASAQVLQSARQLSQQSEDLGRFVDKFLADVRAA